MDAIMIYKSMKTHLERLDPSEKDILSKLVERSRGKWLLLTERNYLLQK